MEKFFLFAALLPFGFWACGSDTLLAKSGADGDYAGSGYCHPDQCQDGWHCEFGECVADGLGEVEPPVGAGDLARSPLSSLKYVYTLSSQAQRLVRIDSQTLEVASFSTGLLPIDLGIIGSREVSIVLDAYDAVEYMDHNQSPPHPAAWTTAPALSSIALSPTGNHAVLYYDWDDNRSAERQPEPGNINQVSILDLYDDERGFNDDDNRLVDIAVGFLPKDVRFSVDGSRAVVISEESITPIALGSGLDGTIAVPSTPIPFNAAATKVVLDSSGTLALLRYYESPRIDVLDLATTETRCFVATGTISDIALTLDDELIAMNEGPLAEDTARYLSRANLTDAVVSVDDAGCTPLAEGATTGTADVLRIGFADEGAIAYRSDLTHEEVFHISLDDLSSVTLPLEKAVAGIAFVGDGKHILVSHLKAPGEPAWDLSIEHPEVSVDKSYGVTWVDLESRSHRLAISETPFGGFAFISEESGQTATYQAVRDPSRPRLMRVAHQPGFDDDIFELAGMPMDLGYLPNTGRAYVTQEHPYGRVTFIDGEGGEMRHVTGFNIASELGGAP